MRHPIATLLLAVSLSASASTKVSQAPWGSLKEGAAAQLYTLRSGEIQVQLTNFGARIVRIDTPDRTGHVADITLGHDSVQAYEADHATYFGSTVGRYGNRIAKGTFTLDGKTFHAPINNLINTLHGGTVGFDHKLWQGKIIPNGVEFTLVSPEGDMGYPGTLTAHLRYTLNGRVLRLEYGATTTAPTVINLTNHSYFNLHGNGRGTILDQKLEIPADRFTPIDKTFIPLGPLTSVAGTPFDFRKPTAIGARIEEKDVQLANAKGYDHNFVLNAGQTSSLHLAARLSDPESGRVVTVTTTEPGVQFYSGNFLDGSIAGIGAIAYPQHAGLCLETQHFPDSPNHPDYPSTVLRPGERYHSVTEYAFGIQR